VVGGPVSGWIMAGLDGWLALRGWQANYTFCQIFKGVEPIKKLDDRV